MRPSGSVYILVSTPITSTTWAAGSKNSLGLCRDRVAVELTETTLPGCYLVKCDVMEDERGRFVKTFHDAAFMELGLRTDWREEYYSVSACGVLRGMHFQVPPTDHAKLVHCVAGEALDVIVDLRIGSPTYGR